MFRLKIDEREGLDYLYGRRYEDLADLLGQLDGDDAAVPTPSPSPPPPPLPPASEPQQQPPPPDVSFMILIRMVRALSNQQECTESLNASAKAWTSTAANAPQLPTLLTACQQQIDHLSQTSSRRERLKLCQTLSESLMSIEFEVDNLEKDRRRLQNGLSLLYQELLTALNHKAPTDGG